MLELIDIHEAEIYDNSFHFIKEYEYINRKCFLNYFIIYSDKDKELYCYTQKDIEHDLFDYNIDVKGLIRDENNNLVGFDKIYSVQTTRNFVIKKPCKLMRGTRNLINTSAGVLFNYKNLFSIYQPYRTFLDTIKDKYGIDYEKLIKDNRNFSIEYIDAYSNYYMSQDILFNPHDNYSIAEKIKGLNEWLEYNIVNNYSQLFMSFNETEIDLSDLNVNYIYDYSRMFKGCNNLERVILCKIDLSKLPIIMKEMFFLCAELELIDMSNLENDYVDNNFYVSEKALLEALNLGLYWREKKVPLIVILPSSCPNFIKLLKKSNNLKYLGKISKNRDIRNDEIQRYKAKLILKGTNNELFGNNNYFLIEV